jgi:chemotaxis protein CheC
MAAFAAGLRGAAARCAAMSGGRLHVASSEVRRLTPAEVLTSAGGGPEEAVVATYVGFSGRLDGHAVLLLAPGEARSLARILLDGLPDGVGLEPSGQADGGLTPLERSAIEEMGNIAVSGVLDPLGDHLGGTIDPTAPVFIHDMAGAVLDGIIGEGAGDDDLVFTARTTFSQDGRAATGVLLVVLAAR